MVKPPKTMQPEGIASSLSSSTSSPTDKKPKKNPHRGMDGDNFRHYMARKIAMQRQQFGIESHLPPLPSPPRSGMKPSMQSPQLSSTKKRKVTFQDFSVSALHLDDAEQGMTNLLERLKRKHTKKRKRVVRDHERERDPSNIITTCTDQELCRTTDSHQHAHHPPDPDDKSHRNRPDLFFRGIVILVNGYTNPDNETLQRLLHKYGGDLEKYETIRLTHIIASQLSFAKAKIYRKQRKAIPVVKPQWIVDCVEQQRLLPHGPYLLEDVKEKGCTSVKEFFSSKDDKGHCLSQDATSNVQNDSTASPPQADLLARTTSSPDVDLDFDSPVDRMSLTLHTQLHHTQMESPRFSQETRPSLEQLFETMSAWDEEVDTNKSVNIPIFSEQDHTSTTGPVDSVLVPAIASVDKHHPSGCSDAKTTSEHSSNLQAHQQNLHDLARMSSGSQASIANLSLDSIQSSSQNDEYPAASPLLQSNNQQFHSTVDDSQISDQISETEAEHESLVDMHPRQRWNSPDRPPQQDTRSNESPQDMGDSDEQKIPQGVLEPYHNGSTHSLTSRTDSKYINGKLRTTGTDPNFLESFFNNSRLSFIGSFKQRTRVSPKKTSSNSMHVDSHRFIFHVDMDCFFAAVVLRNFPQYRDKPVAISHHGNKDGSSVGPVSKTSSSECATCNYEARKFGIKKGMFLGRARELCPSLVVLQYDFEGYEQVSEQVADILYRYADEYDGVVEQVSCDESYMELRLAKQDDDSIHDVVEAIAERIRDEIFSSTECTATIGVGANKLLAKLGTDKAKPDGVYVVRDFHSLLEPLKLRDLHGIGYRSERKLASEGLLLVKDIWDLGEQAEGVLCRILGTTTGKKIMAFCRGEDDREVKPALRKTIGAECSYGVRFDGPYGVDYLVNGLAKEVEKRMTGVGVVGSKLTLKVKQRKAGAKAPPKFLGHGSCHNLSRSLDLPGGISTRDSQVFARFGMQLFSELGVDVDDVRGMGLIVSKLSSKNVGRADSNEDRLSSWLQPSVDMRAKHVSCDSQSMFDNPANDESIVFLEKPALATEVTTGGSSQQVDADIAEDIDDDICLPPQSQVRMSQVEALPSPLKRQITKMLRLRDMVVDEIDDDHSSKDNMNTTAPHQWKQTSVRSLFKLAAVKAGRESLDGPLGESVSLTQLNCLPLEMQLQIAETGHLDSPARGSRCTSLPSTVKSKALFRSSTPHTSAAASASGSGEPELVNVDDDDDIDEPVPPVSPLAITESRRSFYLEDVAPLKAFLDENDPEEDGSRQLLAEYLTTCVREGRLQQVVTLLRSIKNRGDCWSKGAYGQVLDAVDGSIRECTGSSLDRMWLKLS